MSISYLKIDPVLLSIGPIDIRWYSIAYIAGILFGFFYIKFLAKRSNLKLTSKFLEDFIFSIVLGIIIGGRLGYILIYNPMRYIEYPLEALQIWNGGMSFHGGAIGFLIASIIVSKKYKYNYWKILDLSACAAPVGIFFGRIANFINAELFGRVTDQSVPWAMVFPGGGDAFRHPSQLYEALAEGLVLFIVINILFWFYKAYRVPALLSSIFAILYSVFRFALEIYREPDTQMGFIFGYFTMGQILSIIFSVAGACALYLSIRIFKRHRLR